MIGRKTVLYPWCRATTTTVAVAVAICVRLHHFRFICVNCLDTVSVSSSGTSRKPYHINRILVMLLAVDLLCVCSGQRLCYTSWGCQFCSDAVCFEPYGRSYATQIDLSSQTAISWSVQAWQTSVHSSVFASDDVQAKACLHYIPLSIDLIVVDQWWQLHIHPMVALGTYVHPDLLKQFMLFVQTMRHFFSSLHMKVDWPDLMFPYQPMSLGCLYHYACANEQ